MKASDLYSLPASLPFGEFFNPDAAPWEWVLRIGPALENFEWPAQSMRIGGALHVEGPVFVHPSVRLPAYGTIIGPAYIGAGSELRPGVFIRGNVIVGENCVLGNACEFKNALVMDGVQAPHFNYVGDSILGSRCHLAAGVICSNLRLDQAPVPVMIDGARVSSGMKKLGAMIGERAEIGCNAVLQPGTILGKRSFVMPCMAYGGTLEPAHVARTRTSATTFPLRE